MKTYFKTLIALLCTISTAGFAQIGSAKNDFKDINDHYLNLEKVSMSLSFKVFVENSNTPSDVSTGFYRLNSGKLSMKYFGLEMIVNNSKTLVINEESKSIYLDTLRNGENFQPKAMPDTFLDTLFLMYKDVVVSQISANTKKYVFIYENGNNTKTEIYVNTDTKFITKIVSYPVEKFEISEGQFKNVRSEIEFSKINSNPTFVNEFDFSRYVIKVSGTYQLTPQYSGYTLINTL